MLEGIIGEIVKDVLKGEKIDSQLIAAKAYEKLSDELGEETADLIFEKIGGIFVGHNNNDSGVRGSNGSPVLDSNPVEHHTDEENFAKVLGNIEGSGTCGDRRSVPRDRQKAIDDPKRDQCGDQRADRRDDGADRCEDSGENEQHPES
jgi:hypothetical protein